MKSNEPSRYRGYQKDDRETVKESGTGYKLVWESKSECEVMSKGIPKIPRVRLARIMTPRDLGKVMVKTG
jgi:hypothetical protein